MSEILKQKLCKQISKYLCIQVVNMGFKKGIHKCVDCEKKKKEDPQDMGMCSKCSVSETRLERTMFKEMLDDGIFP